MRAGRCLGCSEKDIRLLQVKETSHVTFWDLVVFNHLKMETTLIHIEGEDVTNVKISFVPATGEGFSSWFVGTRKKMRKFPFL